MTTDQTSTPPPMRGVLETVLYYGEDQHQDVADFYTTVLGMRPIGEAPGRFQFYRAGQSVFLLFEREQAREQDRPPPHWSEGKVHTCFVCDGEADYERWRQYLAERGVAITDELKWGAEGMSFYFEDPAGNVLEIANKDFWPA